MSNGWSIGLITFEVKLDKDTPINFLPAFNRNFRFLPAAFAASPFPQIREIDSTRRPSMPSALCFSETVRYYQILFSPAVFFLFFLSIKLSTWLLRFCDVIEILSVHQQLKSVSADRNGTCRNSDAFRVLQKHFFSSECWDRSGGE